jgi:hypothetical protein
LPQSAISEFRTFAARQGVSIPTGADVDAQLQRVLARAVARVKFAESGYYRVAAAMDPNVRAAAQQFDRADAILAKAP